jgi:serine/threonine protein kinase
LSEDETILFVLGASIMGQIYDNRWEIIRSLEEGGQAHTFLVKDLRGQGDTLYVLKRLKNTNRLGRFRQEVETVRNLSHPRIVNTIDFNLEDKHPYLVTEYCEGGSLRKAHPFWRESPTASIRLFLEICDGVQYAHSRGVVHRDLKPDNIFLRTTSGQPVVGDFGICYVDNSEGRFTLKEEAVGPRLYIAPELEDGRADRVTRLSDVYSLGKVLWWLLADGREVFSREQHRVLRWDLKSRNLLTLFGWENLYLEHINRVLDLMITEKPDERRELYDIVALLRRAIRLVEREYTPIGRDLVMPCNFCGEGFYKLVADDPGFASAWEPDAMEWRVIVCNACGHTQIFRIEKAQNRARW